MTISLQQKKKKQRSCWFTTLDLHLLFMLIGQIIKLQWQRHKATYLLVVVKCKININCASAQCKLVCYVDRLVNKNASVEIWSNAFAFIVSLIKLIKAHNLIFLLDATRKAQMRKVKLSQSSVQVEEEKKQKWIW